MAALPIEHFSPIALPELVAEAELLIRVDRKYLLDRSQASDFLRHCDPDTRVLAIEGGRSFRYESVYFDTPDLLSYHQAAHARRHRFKVRTRSYLDSGLAFLEVKVRGDREVTVKDRIDHDPASPEQLDEAGRDYVDRTLHERRLDGSVADRLTPALVTRYRRITLLPPESGVRVTIDTDLSWSHPADQPDSGSHFLPPGAAGRPIWRPAHLSGRNCTAADHDGAAEGLSQPDLVIIETKAGARPSGIDRLLWRSGHRPLSISKYGTGLAALRGDLPANKWARILRHHFRTTEELPCAA